MLNSTQSFPATPRSAAYCSRMADLLAFKVDELRGIATRALAACCDECRAVLREQLERDEYDGACWAES